MRPQDPNDGQCVGREPKYVRILNAIGQLAEVRDMLQTLFDDICGGVVIKDAKCKKEAAEQPTICLLTVLEQSPTVIFNEIEQMRETILEIRERIL